MKKTLLSLGAIALFATANAQEIQSLDLKAEKVYTDMSLEDVQLARQQATETSFEWIGMFNALTEIGGQNAYQGYSLNPIYPVTATEWVNYTDGPVYESVDATAYGQVFDFKSVNFALSTSYGFDITEHSSFSLDSLLFAYQYTKADLNAVDTLVLEIDVISDEDNFTDFPDFPNTGDAFTIPLVGYNSTTGNMVSSVYTDTIVLMSSDIVNSGLGFYGIDLSEDIDIDQYASAAITFKFIPGYEVAVGDTLSANESDVITKAINSFQL